MIKYNFRPTSCFVGKQSYSWLKVGKIAEVYPFVNKNAGMLAGAIDTFKISYGSQNKSILGTLNSVI